MLTLIANKIAPCIVALISHGIVAVWIVLVSVMTPIANDFVPHVVGLIVHGIVAVGFVFL